MANRALGVPTCRTATSTAALPTDASEHLRGEHERVLGTGPLDAISPTVVARTSRRAPTAFAEELDGGWTLRSGPLRALDVVGAGTGTGTLARALVATGADVVAVEPVSAMCGVW